MEQKNLDYFSNLHIDYYYGSYTQCNERWKEHNIVCPFSKFYYITAGECEIKVAGKAYHGQQGRMFFIPAQTQHSFYHINENYVTKYWIHFELKAGDETLLNNLKLPIFCDIDNDSNVVSYFKDILTTAKINTLSASFRLKARILDLFSEYLTQSSINNISILEENNQDFNRMLTFIVENLQDKLTIDQMAGLMHIHPNYFIRLFKKKMGIPPRQYVNQLRIERAKALLENTNLPISEIMFQIGFDDLSTFSNFFKHYSGYNPKNFRKTFGKVQNWE